jgi:hypothetical protein
VGVFLSSKFIAAFLFPFGVGVAEKRVSLVCRVGTIVKYLPLVVLVGGAAPRNVTNAISAQNLFEVPATIVPTKMPVTPTNLALCGFGIGLWVQPSGNFPLQRNAAFLLGKLIH